MRLRPATSATKSRTRLAALPPLRRDAPAMPVASSGLIHGRPSTWRRAGCAMKTAWKPSSSLADLLGVPGLGAVSNSARA